MFVPTNARIHVGEIRVKAIASYPVIRVKKGEKCQKEKIMLPIGIENFEELRTDNFYLCRQGGVDLRPFE